MFEDIIQPAGRNNFQREELKIMNKQVTSQKEAAVIDATRDNMESVEMGEARADLLRWQQDLDAELLKLAMSLKGFTKVNGEWTKTSELPKCNDIFIYNIIIPECEPYFSRNLINSNLDEEKINYRLKSTMNSITGAMAHNWSEYSIGGEDGKFNVAIANTILDQVKSTIIPTPFRALKGWTKRLDNTMNKRIEAFTGAEDTKKRALFSLKRE